MNHWTNIMKMAEREWEKHGNDANEHRIRGKCKVKNQTEVEKPVVVLVSNFQV